MSAEVWEQLYDRLADLIERAPDNAYFRQYPAPRRTRDAPPLREAGCDKVQPTMEPRKGTAVRAEQRLKRGQLKAMVATASLELGIDIGDVDLVCQLGSPRSIASFPAAGRALRSCCWRNAERAVVSAFPGRSCRMRSLLDGVRHGELDRLDIPERPLDVLAQQIVAEVAAQEWARTRFCAGAPGLAIIATCAQRISRLQSVCWPRASAPAAGAGR